MLRGSIGWYPSSVAFKEPPADSMANRPPADATSNPPSIGQDAEVEDIFGGPNVMSRMGPRHSERSRIRINPSVTVVMLGKKVVRSRSPLSDVELATESSTVTVPSTQRIASNLRRIAQDRAVGPDHRRRLA